MENKRENNESSYYLTEKEKEKLRKSKKRKDTRVRVLTKLRRGTTLGMIFFINSTLLVGASTKISEKTVDLTVYETYVVSTDSDSGIGEVELFYDTQIMQLEDNSPNNSVVVKIEKTGEELEEYSFNTIDYINPSIEDTTPSSYDTLLEDATLSKIIVPDSNEDLQNVVYIQDIMDKILANEDTDTKITITLNYVKDDLEVSSFSYGNIFIIGPTVILASYAFYKALMDVAALKQISYQNKTENGEPYSDYDFFWNSIYNSLKPEEDYSRKRKR